MTLIFQKVIKLEVQLGLMECLVVKTAAVTAK